MRGVKSSTQFRNEKQDMHLEILKLCVLQTGMHFLLLLLPLGRSHWVSGLHAAANEKGFRLQQYVRT
jgi:hypothetical protein